MELTLRQTTASGFLLPARFTQAFGLLARLAPEDPWAVMRGQELRLGRALKPEDDACAGFILDFAGQGQRVEGAAHGPSAALLVWAFHALASHVKCDLLRGGSALMAVLGTDRARAFAYLDAYEAEVLADRKTRRELDGPAFVGWLAREEHLALTTPPGETDANESFAVLALDDAAAVYEALLEAEGVDDMFVSERELTRLLARFKARASKA